MAGEVQGADGGVKLGQVLAAKYRVERVLGVGGMGVVVAARNIALDERVALKFLRTEALANTDAIARFFREARAAAKIKNEHVARVIDVGVLDDGSPYMVMEYLEGRDLAAWLEHRGPLSIPQAVDFVLQACEAIAEAHALGIVHRDLKPANLFCIQRSDGQLAIKVLDFGISKLTQPGGAKLEMTKTSELMGSPYYMSPEQMKHARSVDAGTDLWSLGIILYELLIGRPPFVAETVMELAIKVATEPAPMMRQLRPEVPALLEAIVFRCLEKERFRRYESVAELAMALVGFGSPQASASLERIVGITRSLSNAGGVPAISSSGLADILPAAKESGTIPPLGRTDRSAPSMSRTGLAAALALIAVVVGAGVLVRHRKPVESPESSWATAAPRESASAQPPPPASATAIPEPAPTTDPLPPLVTKPPAHPPSRTPSSPAHRPSSPECDPPFILDDQGRKHFKHECYPTP